MLTFLRNDNGGEGNLMRNVPRAGDYLANQQRNALIVRFLVVRAVARASLETPSRSAAVNRAVSRTTDTPSPAEATNSMFPSQRIAESRLKTCRTSTAVWKGRKTAYGRLMRRAK